jgi:hypothetical protein
MARREDLQTCQSATVARSGSKGLGPLGTPTALTGWEDGYNSTGRNWDLGGLSNLLAAAGEKLAQDLVQDWVFA